MPDAAVCPVWAGWAKVQARIRDTWICWFGRFTHSYWGIPRRPHPWWGLVEARTPVDLLIRICEIDADHGIHRSRPGATG